SSDVCSSDLARPPTPDGPSPLRSGGSPLSAARSPDAVGHAPVRSAHRARATALSPRSSPRDSDENRRGGQAELPFALDQDPLLLAELQVPGPVVGGPVPDQVPEHQQALDL